MVDVLQHPTALADTDNGFEQQAQQQLGQAAVEEQSPGVRAVALLTSTLLGQLGDEGDELAEDEASGDEGLEALKLQARKPHLQGRFSGTSSL